MAKPTRVDRRQFDSLTGAIFLVVLIGMLGCDPNKSPLTEEDLIKYVFENEENYKIVSSAATVEAFTIDPSSQELNWGKATVEDYPIIEGPIELKAENATEFINYMTQKNSFNDGLGVKGCRPIPGVRIKFTSTDKSIDVLICFFCAHLGVFEDGKLIGWGNFDYTEERLIRMVQNVFPDDPKIQELSE